MAFNRKQKLRDNIEAIRTAFILDRENRTATTEERAILQRYCGFGGLKCILNPAKELTDAVRWAKSDLELFAPTVELHRLIRENSKDETEYKRFVDSLKASVLTAFYTPKEITDTIADVLADYSVRPARMLEPSAGVGVFVDSMLRHNPNADVMAFEKDLLTGTILRLQKRIDAVKKKNKSSDKDLKKALIMCAYNDETFGTYKSALQESMLNQLGYTNVATGTSDLTLENLVSMEPELIIYVTSDRNKAMDKEATDKMEKNAVLENVPAVKNKKIMTISYDELMDYGPSVIDSLEKVNDFVNK